MSYKVGEVFTLLNLEYKIVEEINGYYLSCIPYYNGAIFYSLTIQNKEEYISNIVGYKVDAGDAFPVVATIEDINKVIVKLKEDCLIKEVELRYPKGTKFWPAHLSTPEEGHFCISHGEFKVFDNQVFAVPVNPATDSKVWAYSSSIVDGNVDYSRWVYYEGKWAQVINDAVEPEQPASKSLPYTYKFKVGDKVKVIDNGMGCSTKCIGEVVEILELADYNGYPGYITTPTKGSSNSITGNFNGVIGEGSFELYIPEKQKNKVIPAYVKCIQSYGDSTVGEVLATNDDELAKANYGLTWEEVLITYENLGPYFIEATKEEYDAQMKESSMFKRDDYIVYLGEAKSDQFLINNCFKQREDNECLVPYLDSIGSKRNGWGYIEYKTASRWRYATPAEIAEYDKQGRPYDVTTLNTPTGAVCETCMGTGEVMIGKLYPTGHTEVTEICPDCNGNGTINTSIERWAEGTYVVALENGIRCIGKCLKGDVFRLYGGGYANLLKDKSKLWALAQDETDCKWFATLEEAEAFAKTLVAEITPNPGFEIGRWYEWYQIDHEVTHIGRIDTISDEHFSCNPWLINGNSYSSGGTFEIRYASQIKELDVADKRIQSLLPKDSKYYIPTVPLPFKPGDTFTILRQPPCWDSSLGGKMGLNSVKYPYVATVKTIASKDGDIAIYDGVYGWSYYKDLFVYGGSIDVEGKKEEPMEEKKSGKELSLVEQAHRDGKVAEYLKDVDVLKYPINKSLCSAGKFESSPSIEGHCTGFSCFGCLLSWQNRQKLIEHMKAFDSEIVIKPANTSIIDKTLEIYKQLLNK